MKHGAPLTEVYWKACVSVFLNDEVHFTRLQELVCFSERWGAFHASSGTCVFFWTMRCISRVFRNLSVFLNDEVHFTRLQELVCFSERWGAFHASSGTWVFFWTMRCISRVFRNLCVFLNDEVHFTRLQELVCFSVFPLTLHWRRASFLDKKRLGLFDAVMTCCLLVSESIWASLNTDHGRYESQRVKLQDKRTIVWRSEVMLSNCSVHTGSAFCL